MKAARKKRIDVEKRQTKEMKAERRRTNEVKAERRQVKRMERAKRREARRELVRKRNEPPLLTKEDHAQFAAQIEQQKRSERAADQKKDRGIVKAPANPLRAGPRRHGVIDTAH